MDSKDLRIGNILQEKKYKTPQRINEFFGLFTVEVDSPYFDYETDDCHTPCLGNLEPIPLTQEWLLKFGFEEDSCNYYKIIENQEAVLYIDKLDATFAYGYPYECSGGDLKLKHVHQLQNLYYALTKKELTIKK